MDEQDRQIIDEDAEPEMENDIFAFIHGLDNSIVQSLYSGCRWSTVAVVRSLHPVAQHIMLSLSTLDAKVPKQWLSKVSKSDRLFTMGLKQLSGLKLITIDSKGNVSLQDEARREILSCLTSYNAITLPWQSNETQYGAKMDIDTRDVEYFAKRKWTGILHFIVGSKEYQRPEPSVINVLLKIQLMKKRNDGAKITRRGYEFMLQDTHTQVWRVVMHYIQIAANCASALQFIFRLSFCEPGTFCSIKLLDKEQRQLLEDFEKFGLVYIDRKNSADYFSPTSFGRNIVFGETREEVLATTSKAIDLNRDSTDNRDTKKKPTAVRVKCSSVDDTDNSIFIIVETNFKVYAYTKSALHIEMLRLFLDIEIILPNLVVAVVSRGSVRNALKLGISAEQLIDFLQKHVHPLCHKNVTLVPDNVTDQIRLWEMERNRIQIAHGVLFEKFVTEKLFNDCVQYANKKRWLIYSNSNTRSLVVGSEYYEQMKSKLKELKGTS